jgi:ubiquinone/menaquinone biosynthesis C-methylase UbiE
VSPDFAAIRDRQQATWSTGDYARIGNTIPIVSELLCEAVDLRSHERVLDVATGSGNAAIAAARRWCTAVGTDYVPALLEQARRRAAADGFDVRFETADADRQPFEDASFDVVLSVFGVMFAPQQETSAKELLRVCKPGGRIGLVNWTPEGLIGQMFKVIGRFVAPPAGVESPLRWGTRARLEELFGPAASSISATLRDYVFRFHSAEQFLEIFKTWYGPMTRAFAALDAGKQGELSKELLELFRKHDRGGGRSLVMPSQYLEAVIQKR